MINELIKKYQDNLNSINDEQQKFEEEKHNTKDNNYREYCLCIIERCKEAKSIYQEILKDLEELQEKIYQNLCGQYKYVYDKEEDFNEVAAGVFQCKVDEEVFYQNDRFNGKIYNLTFLGIVGVDTDE